MEELTSMAKHEKTPQELFAERFVKELQPKSVEDVETYLKSILGPIFESMLKGELEAHLGYESNDHQPKETSNRRNGFIQKTLKSSAGEIPIKSPRDRDGTFTPICVPKRKTDISGIEDKVISMYAKGMSQRDISDVIKDIYGFKLSASQISIITDNVIDEMLKWQERPLNKMYSFMFVDCLYVSIRTEFETKKHAVYCIVAYDLSGKKDILGLWIAENESKSEWAKIFDELKRRGVEDIGFISMDGLPGLEEGAKNIFPKAIVQRCIVHLIRNSIKYIPAKLYKEFTANLKLIYRAPNKKVALLEFEKFKERWHEYPGAVKVWENNWNHVEQLFNYTLKSRHFIPRIMLGQVLP
ncbi:Transposase (or an inactivated derivative) [Butyrivibrio sp. INlla21]|nr:Transposase (or an inactivated derivative) [Butyrivibrio sp. INlla21]